MITELSKQIRSNHNDRLMLPSFSFSRLFLLLLLAFLTISGCSRLQTSSLHSFLRGEKKGEDPELSEAAADLDSEKNKSTAPLLSRYNPLQRPNEDQLDSDGISSALHSQEKQMKLLKDMYDATKDETIKKIIAQKLPSLNSGTPTNDDQQSASNTNSKDMRSQSSSNLSQSSSEPTNREPRENLDANMVTHSTPAKNSIMERSQSTKTGLQAQQSTDSTFTTNVRSAVDSNYNQASALLNQHNDEFNSSNQTSARFIDRNLSSGGLKTQTVGFANDQILVDSSQFTEARSKATFAENSKFNLNEQSDNRPIKLGEWKRQLLQTVELLKKTKEQQELGESEKAYLELSLRLLHLIQGNHEKAVEAVEDLSQEEQEFWKEQLFAMTRIIDDPSNNASTVFATRQKQAFRALQHLRNATSHLAAVASLDVRNLRFCTDVSGYGQYKETENNSFSPNQQIIVYCEIENWKTEENATRKGARFTSRIQGSYAILDENRQIVKQSQYPVVEDSGRNRRRDFYLYFPVTIPKLDSGTYHLQLTIDDLVGNKTSTARVPLTFRIR